jgi:hypothetical protein
MSDRKTSEEGKKEEAFRMVHSKDSKDEPVTVKVNAPTQKEWREANKEYSIAFKKAVEDGAMIKAKLDLAMRDQGIWDDDKESLSAKLIDEIQQKIDILEEGGISLTEAKEIAVDVRRKRMEFRDLIGARQTMESNTVEGQADNARFNCMVTLCIVHPETNQRIFPNIDAYDKDAVEPWAIEAAGELANLLYGLDKDYDKGLEENKFLSEYDLCDEDLHLINENGHKVDVDGKLVDDVGRYVAYRTPKAEKEKDEKKRYFVNKDGQEVDSEGKRMLEKKPFLDENGKAILSRTERETLEQEKAAKKAKAKAQKTEVENA